MVYEKQLPLEVVGWDPVNNEPRYAFVGPWPCNGFDTRVVLSQAA
jgi:hypothetical protein